MIADEARSRLVDGGWHEAERVFESSRVDWTGSGREGVRDLQRAWRCRGTGRQGGAMRKNLCRKESPTGVGAVQVSVENRDWVDSIRINRASLGFWESGIVCVEEEGQ